MTRIEDPSLDPWIKKVDEKEKLKDEIRGEVVREMKTKKRKKFFTCCFFELLIIILILGGLVAAVAKTGVITIPVFSKLFYDKPAPQRIVSISPDETKSFEEKIAEKLEQLKFKTPAAGENPEVALEFTEEELTGFIKSVEADENSPFAGSQVSVSPEGVELFGELKDLNRAFLTITLKPEVINNNFKISFQKIKLGNLSLPASLGNFLVDRLLKDQFDSAEKSIAEFGKLESIELFDGKIIFRGQLDASAFTE